MAKTLRVAELSDRIAEVLKNYDQKAADAAKRAVDRVTRGVAKEIKAHTMFENRTGDYIRSLRTTTSYEDMETKRNTWYAQAPHYRLTHLLEFGHDVRDRNGVLHGRTRAFPHVHYGYDYMVQHLPEEIEQEIKKCG